MGVIEERKKLKKATFFAYLEGEIGDFTYMTRKERVPLKKEKRIFNRRLRPTCFARRISSAV